MGINAINTNASELDSTIAGLVTSLQADGVLPTIEIPESNDLNALSVISVRSMIHGGASINYGEAYNHIKSLLDADLDLIHQDTTVTTQDQYRERAFALKAKYDQIVEDFRQATSHERSQDGVSQVLGYDVMAGSPRPLNFGDLGWDPRIVQKAIGISGGPIFVTPSENQMGTEVNEGVNWGSPEQLGILDKVQVAVFLGFRKFLDVICLNTVVENAVPTTTMITPIPDLIQSETNHLVNLEAQRRMNDFRVAFLG